MNALTTSVPHLPAPPPAHSHAAEVRGAYHAEVVRRVAEAVAKHDVLVVGMAWNQPVKQARRFLEAKGIAYEYLEIGNYLGMWKERLAVKLWSGWPTFPQVYIKGQLVGGASDLKKLDASGELARLLGK